MGRVIVCVGSSLALYTQMCKNRLCCAKCSRSDELCSPCWDLHSVLKELNRPVHRCVQTELRLPCRIKLLCDGQVNGGLAALLYPAG